MPAARSHVERIGLSVLLLGAVAIGGAAVVAVHDGRGNDVAWVAIALALTILGWVGAYLGLGPDRPDDAATDDAATADAATADAATNDAATNDAATDDAATDVDAPSHPTAAAHSLRSPTWLLSNVVALTAGYVVIRLTGRPVDSALVGASGFLLLRILNRAVDAWIRRRAARGGAGSGPAPAPAD